MNSAKQVQILVPANSSSIYKTFLATTVRIIDTFKQSNVFDAYEIVEGDPKAPLSVATTPLLISLDCSTLLLIRTL